MTKMVAVGRHLTWAHLSGQLARDFETVEASRSNFTEAQVEMKGAEEDWATLSMRLEAWFYGVSFFCFSEPQPVDAMKDDINPVGRLFFFCESHMYSTCLIIRNRFLSLFISWTFLSRTKAKTLESESMESCDIYRSFSLITFRRCNWHLKLQRSWGTNPKVGQSTWRFSQEGFLHGGKCHDKTWVP